MSRSIKTLAVALGLAATALAAPASADTVSTATGSFTPGSGLYLTSPDYTDGLSLVGGSVTFKQAGSGASIAVSGRVTGLRPLTRYVAVPYKDGTCIPAPGITAFPSGSFITDMIGVARIPAGVAVNPAAINPAGTLDVTEVHSVSIRMVVLATTPLPTLPGYPNGVPTGTPIVLPPATPNVPNVAFVEGCDRTPVLN